MSTQRIFHSVSFVEAVEMNVQPLDAIYAFLF